MAWERKVMRKAKKRRRRVRKQLWVSRAPLQNWIELEEEASCECFGELPVGKEGGRDNKKKEKGEDTIAPVPLKRAIVEGDFTPCVSSSSTPRAERGKTFFHVTYWGR